MKKFIISFMLVLTSIFAFAQSNEPVVLHSYKQAQASWYNGKANFGSSYYCESVFIINHARKTFVIQMDDYESRTAIIEIEQHKSQSGADIFDYEIVDKTGDIAHFIIFVQPNGEAWAVLRLSNNTGYYFPDIL